MQIKCFGLLLFTAASAALAADVDEAAAVVADLHLSLVELAATDPLPALEQRVSRLTPVIVATHDLQTMGRVTISRRFWRAWNDAERDRYIDAFERFSITTYASRFASIRPGQFEILGSDQLGDDRVEVKGVFHRDGVDAADVTMDYTVRRSDDGWRIVNIVADGASELSLMSARNFDLLESGDFEDLITDLEEQTSALE
jgi:phospholipid transport system substrate-binding protein